MKNVKAQDIGEARAIMEIRKFEVLADCVADAIESISIRSEDALSQVDRAERLAFLLQDAISDFLSEYDEKDA